MVTTASTLRGMKAGGTKFAGLVVYDVSFARLAQEAGIEVVVVGDSLGMSLLGHRTTVETTMDDMVYHTRAVAAAQGQWLLIGDMPFMSYATPADARRNAALLMQAGAHMVKVEGGDAWVVDAIARLVQHGIPVCGHLGLTPQFYYRLGGHKVQGEAPQAAAWLLKEARAVQDAGAELLVLECIPKQLAAEVTAELAIPTLGAGAGVDCDGQILLAYDVLGLSPKRLKFAKNYLLGEQKGPLAAFQRFAKEVHAGDFPTDEHSFLTEQVERA